MPIDHPTMYSSHLKIDTSIRAQYPFARGKGDVSPSPTLLVGQNLALRVRSISNASSASSLDIISPKSSSTNASTSSLIPPEPNPQHGASPVSPALDDAIEGFPEYVLALHDYSPQHQAATCLSFRAGQVIHVLNRDSSGWWDGELEGKRGWFPSNYVNVDGLGAPLAEDEEDEEEDLTQVPTHKHATSIDSSTSWLTQKSIDVNQRHRRQPSLAESLNSDGDSYCPAIMVPLLQGLSILQNAVRSNRISHFQPSTACIISCVRSILSATETLVRDAPVLQHHPNLAQERRKILTVLASLVAQAKKASEEALDEQSQELEVEAMLRLGGQVFARVRGFLAIAVQCGIEIPDRKPSSESGDRSTETEAISSGSMESSTPSYRRAPSQAPRGARPLRGSSGALRTISLNDIRARRNEQLHATDVPLPVLPSASAGAPAKQEEYLRERILRRQPPIPTHNHSPSSSSLSSFDSESVGTPVQPPFPQGQSTTVQITEALRYTHDHYLSTIAAFIGHAHSYSRSSHASSTGHMYELVREIIEVVCRLLGIVEAVSTNSEVPEHKVKNLRLAREGLYSITNRLAESVRVLTQTLPPDMTDEDEKQLLLRSATSALKAGADCVAAVKMCLTRAGGEPLVFYVPSLGESGNNSLLHSQGTDTNDADSDAGDDLTVPYLPPNLAGSVPPEIGSTYRSAQDENPIVHDALKDPPSPLTLADGPVEPDLASPTSTTWEGSLRGHAQQRPLPHAPLEPVPEADPAGWILSHDYSQDDVAYNGDGHLVGATMPVLVEKMTPHDSIVDPAFSAVFFLTFRLFSSPLELVDALIARYNLVPPQGATLEAVQLWQQRKGIPVRLRVSNFVKIWVETYWRSGADECAILSLATFVREGIAIMFPGPAQRILEMLDIRRQSSDMTISPKGDRVRDPGMPINPPNAPMSPSEIPRPTMTKALLAALRTRHFDSISITDFDALELARQLTIMECNLYCAIQAEEILETGQDGVKRPVNVRAVSTLSTIITGWISESILNEQDLKKRTALIKFFIKVADRCTSLHNYSTSRSILAALDSSTISRLRQTWAAIPQKSRIQLEALRKLADHSRNYHEYRSTLRNTAPPAVPFLGIYLTDVTFCREGNPSHRASPHNQNKKLINFNKYHKLARIVQDMQRFQVPYNLKAIPEAQDYLNVLFEDSKRNGDLQDLYRRSLLVEPKRPADPTPSGEVRQLFNWAGKADKSQPSSQPP